MLRCQQISGSDGGLRDTLVAADLPVEDIEAGGRRFFRFDSDGRTVAYGGFEPHGQYALLRSMVVLPEARGKGFGRVLAEAVIEQARSEGCSEGFVLTTTAVDFFGHLGFNSIDRDHAPKEILATQQATTICSTATLLVRPLTK